MIKNYAYVFIFFLIQSAVIGAICNNPDRHHADANIVHCPYSQEDIYRCYSKKLHCYGCIERRKQCFYCGCAIAEHTKHENGMKVASVRK